MRNDLWLRKVLAFVGRAGHHGYRREVVGRGRLQVYRMWTLEQHRSEL